MNTQNSSLSIYLHFAIVEELSVDRNSQPVPKTYLKTNGLICVYQKRRVLKRPNCGYKTVK